MSWWFLVLGVSTLAVVCVAIALFVHLRKHLQKTHDSHNEPFTDSKPNPRSDRVED